MDAADARAFLTAGARAVQVGTALFHDPTAAHRIAAGPPAEGDGHDQLRSQLHAAVQDRGPLCAGIDPHASLLADWGLDDDVAGLERFALTAAEALAPRVAVVKPQSAFYERFGSRGIAVLERLVTDLPRRRRAGAARRQARRHRLHQPGVRRRLPRPVLAAGRRRDHRQPLPRLRLAGPDDRHRPPARAGVFVLALTSNQEGPEVQEARTRATGGTVADVVLDHLRDLNPAPTPLGVVRGGGRRHHRPTATTTWTSTGRSSHRGTAPRAAPSTTCGGSSARPSATSCPARRASSLERGTRRPGRRRRPAQRPAPRAGRMRVALATATTLMLLPLMRRVRARRPLLRHGPGPSVRPRLDRPRRRPRRAHPGTADLRGPLGRRHPTTSPTTGSCW